MKLPIDKYKKLWYYNYRKRKGVLKMSKKVNPYAIKMDAEQLQMYLHFRKRGGKSAMKKGKGSYNRQEQKKAVKEW